MRLADFNSHDMERILVEWEAFAATVFPAAASMTPGDLRDDANRILGGRGERFVNPPDKASSGREVPRESPETHGSPGDSGTNARRTPPRSGFDINQLAAEDRALRASVLRRWTDACQPDELDLEDVIRFNEAIDQALAESIGVLSAQVDRARNLPFGMLDHDMRNPLNAIQMTALLGRIERRHGGIGSGGVPNPQWSLHKGAARRLSRFQSNQIGLGYQYCIGQRRSGGSVC